MKNNTFGRILMGIFGIMGLLGIMAFAGYIPWLKSDKKESKEDVKIYGDVVMWGTLPSIFVNNAINTYAKDEKRIKFYYYEKDSSTLYNELLESLVSETSPDLLLIPHELLSSYVEKLTPISYSPQFDEDLAISERMYKNTYIEASEIYLYDEGIMAIPLLVDPLVMYWNRDTLSSNSIIKQPVLWDEFNAIVPKLTRLDSSGHIVRSGNAMGEYQNIINAKEILSLLFLQADVPIVNKLKSTLKVGITGKNAEDVIKFYMQFSNSLSDLYSWNRSLEDSLNMFGSGDLAFYFGYASELNQIKKKSPHLNFDVAIVPQKRAEDVRITTGKLVGVSMVVNSRNKAGSKWGMSQLGSKHFLEILKEQYNLPPVRRDMMSFYGDDSNKTTFVEAALITKVWMDPEPEISDAIFADMIQNIMSDRFEISSALSTAQNKLIELF